MSLVLHTTSSFLQFDLALPSYLAPFVFNCKESCLLWFWNKYLRESSWSTMFMSISQKQLCICDLVQSHWLPFISFLKVLWVFIGNNGLCVWWLHWTFWNFGLKSEFWIMSSHTSKTWTWAILRGKTIIPIQLWVGHLLKYVVNNISYLNFHAT
jgi:hypothetical protein